MSWLSGWFGIADKLPKIGDKVGFSDNVLKDFPHLKGNKCFRVVNVKGDSKNNTIYLHCGTVLHEGQWKKLPQETPINA